MTRKHRTITKVIPPHDDLAGFACPNEDCGDFNRFAAGNLTVGEVAGQLLLGLDGRLLRIDLVAM